MLDERTRRVTAANEAMAWGDGGISAVSRACGLSRRVIRRGIEELTERRALAAGRIRRPGGGRKAITVTDPALVRTLEAAIADETRGAPLRDHETVVKLIARTTTAKGLMSVTCRLDRRKYATGRTVTKAEMQHINLHPQRFHGEWNYVIRPRQGPVTPCARQLFSRRGPQIRAFRCGP